MAQKQYEEKEGIVHESTNKSRTQAAEEARKLPRNAQQLWTDDDLTRLAKLIKKYPGGTPDRWETIAEMMERLPWEVTKMAGTIKGSSYQVCALDSGFIWGGGGGVDLPLRFSL